MPLLWCDMNAYNADVALPYTQRICIVIKMNLCCPLLFPFLNMKKRRIEPFIVAIHQQTKLSFLI